jgi:hypothetical protein
MYLLILCNVVLIVAQNSVFTSSDSVYIKRTITEPLRLIKETHDGKILYENSFNMGCFREVNRKKFPELWLRNLQAQIELSLGFANELMNHFDLQKVTSMRQNAGVLLPPCFYDERPVPDSINGIKNKECYELCVKLIQEENAKIAIIEFEQPIKNAFSKNIFYITSYFQKYNQNLTEADIDKYVYPMISRYIDSEAKQIYFKKSLDSYLGRNINQKQ